MKLYHAITILGVMAMSFISITSAGKTRKVCAQSPIELGIVMDSSLSIKYPDFQKGKEFLHNLIDLYEIGTGPTDVRVSIISFGKGIYPEDAFNLTTYTTQEEVLEAVDELPHEFGIATYTGDGIDYMSNVQLSTAVSRPYAGRVGVVITDGQSTNAETTRTAAAAARDSGITLIAVGVGKNVNHDELLTITGTESRVLEVGNYDQLQSIMGKLADLICHHEPVPTTPLPALCPVVTPSHVHFVVSPGELGIGGNAFVASVISSIKNHLGLAHNYSFSLFTGAQPSCSEKTGVNLDGNTENIFETLTPKLGDIAMQLVNSNISQDAQGVRNVAVLVVMDRGGKRSEGLGTSISALDEAGFKVYVVKPYKKYRFVLDAPSAVTLETRTTLDVRDELTANLCGKN